MIRSVFIFAVGIFISQFSFAQVKIDAPQGSFEDFFKWGDGYIGSVQRNMIATLPKEREFFYFSDKGTKKWSRSIDPKSGWNEFVVNEKGNYAYFIDIANLTEGGIWQREYPNDLFIVYRLDTEGKMEKIPVNYGELFADHFGSAMEGMTIEYFAATENGLVGVFNKQSAKKDWDKSFVMFKLSDDGSMKTVKLDFELSEADWKGKKKSELHFQMDGGKIFIMQMGIISGGFEFEINTYSSLDLSETHSVKNTYAMEAGVNYGQFVFEQVKDPQQEVRNQYSYVKRKGDTYYTIFTLGSLINLQVDNGQLYGVGNYFIPEAKGALRPNEVQGVYALKFSTEDIDELSGDKVIKHDLKMGPKSGTVFELSSQISKGKIVTGVLAKKTFGYCVNDAMLKEVDVKNGYSAVLPAIGNALDGQNISGISQACLVYEYPSRYVIIEKLKIAPAMNGIKSLNVYTIDK